VQSAFTELYPGYVAAVGPPSCADIHCGYELKMNNSLRYALIYHGFEFLWTTQFIIAFSILTVSQVVYRCYLAAGGTGVELPRWPLGRAMFNTARFYLGSCALGSLVVASVQFFRYAVMYFMQRLKKVAENNAFVRVLMWLVNCLLWLLQKIVELISHNAYVIIAIEGTGFCSSDATATRVMTDNFVRLATLTMVADSMLFLGKLGTAATSAFFTFVYLDKTFPDGKLSSPIIPVIVVFLTAFAIASVGFGVAGSVEITFACPRRKRRSTNSGISSVSSEKTDPEAITLPLPIFKFTKSWIFMMIALRYD
jgi:choline transporter-like protein 2/4/5